MRFVGATERLCPNGAARAEFKLEPETTGLHAGMGQLPVQIRRLHGAVAPLVLTPLLLTVASGMAYRLLKDWGGLSRDQAHWLMVLHEGEWLGHAAEPFYVLLNGLGLLWMLITGGVMLSQRWLKRAAVKTPAP
jgi:hypothetical protein